MNIYVSKYIVGVYDAEKDANGGILISGNTILKDKCTPFKIHSLNYGDVMLLTLDNKHAVAVTPDILKLGFSESEYVADQHNGVSDYA